MVPMLCPFHLFKGDSLREWLDNRTVTKQDQINDNLYEQIRIFLATFIINDLPVREQHHKTGLSISYGHVIHIYVIHII